MNEPNKYKIGQFEITQIDDAEMAKDLVGFTEGDVLVHRPSDGAIFLGARKDGQVFRLTEQFNEEGQFTELVWESVWESSPEEFWRLAEEDLNKP